MKYGRLGWAGLDNEVECSSGGQGGGEIFRSCAGGSRYRSGFLRSGLTEEHENSYGNLGTSTNNYPITP